MEVITKPQCILLIERYLYGKIVREWLVVDVEDLRQAVDDHKDILKGVYRIIEKDGIPTLQRLQ